MTDEPTRPAPARAAEAALRARHAREAAALRENLRRRKEQSRPKPPPEEPPPSP